MSRLHARDRKVGFVFQHYALFRHMTVFDNIAFGLTVLPRRERPNAAAIKAKVTKLLEMVQLAHLADRYPAQLSGGQNSVWRLHARWLWNRKFCCLMNRLARWMRRCVKSCVAGCVNCMKNWKFTSVFVTHDQEEATEVADRVVVMSQAILNQADAPDQVWREPATRLCWSLWAR